MIFWTVSIHRREYEYGGVLFSAADRLSAALTAIAVLETGAPDDLSVLLHVWDTTTDESAIVLTAERGHWRVRDLLALRAA